jgi:hypothetical protein
MELLRTHDFRQQVDNINININININSVDLIMAKFLW